MPAVGTAGQWTAGHGTARDGSARPHGRVRDLMGAAGCDALLVSRLVNVRYLTGFSGSAGLLLVRAGDAVLITDGRYGVQASAELGRAGADAELEVLAAGEQPALLAGLAGGIWPARPGGGTCQLGQPEALLRGLGQEHNWSRRPALSSTCASARMRASGHDSCRRCCRSRRCFCPGEADVSARAQRGRRCRRPGHPNAPAWVRRRLVRDHRRLRAERGRAPPPPGLSPARRRGACRAGLGARVEGYCSECHPDGPRRRGRRPSTPAEPGALSVLASQDAGLSAVRDGVRASEVDRACREVVEAAGLGELFVHGTGHGVGLDIHEAPSLAAQSEDILCSGQVVTVEPGVYIPGFGGARAEDTVVVTDAGCEVLTLAPKELAPKELAPKGTSSGRPAPRRSAPE